MCWWSFKALLWNTISVHSAQECVLILLPSSTPCGLCKICSNPIFTHTCVGLQPGRRSNINVVFKNYISNYTSPKPHCWVTYRAVQLCDTRTHLLLSAHFSFHSVLNECGLVLRCTVMNSECVCQQHWLATRWIKCYVSSSRCLQQTQWVGFSSEKRC